METKRCSKCGEVKAVDAFYKEPRVKSGLSGRCKVCAIVQGQSYRDDNRETINATERIRNNARREYHRIYQRKNYAKYAAHRTVVRRAWRRANRERLPDSLIKTAIIALIKCNVGVVVDRIGIPPELIEAKRAHLQMVRILKKEKQK